MQTSHRVLLAAASAAFGLGVLAQAGKPIAYPAKGQSSQQQSKDDGECRGWAQKNTGIDPSAPPPPAAPPPQTSVGGGVARGAAAGAAIGAIGGNDVGSAAAKGAVVGGVARHSRNRGAQEAAAQQNQQAQAQQGQSMDTFYRAYGSCMSGRGYSLN